MFERFSRKGKMDARIAAYCANMVVAPSSHEESRFVHHLRCELDPEFEQRLRSIQVLFELDYVPATTLAARELMARMRMVATGEIEYEQNDNLMRMIAGKIPRPIWQEREPNCAGGTETVGA